MRYLDVAGRSPRTVQSYTESAQLLADHCKNADLLTLTKSDVESFILAVRRQSSVRHRPGPVQVGQEFL